MLPNLSALDSRFHGNDTLEAWIQTSVRFLFWTRMEESSKTFRGAALPLPKRLRAGRCKGFSTNPTAFWEHFYVNVRTTWD
jgi:hypothetical protein